MPHYSELRSSLQSKLTTFAPSFSPTFHQLKAQCAYLGGWSQLLLHLIFLCLSSWQCQMSFLFFLLLLFCFAMLLTLIPAFQFMISPLREDKNYFFPDLNGCSFFFCNFFFVSNGSKTNSFYILQLKAFQYCSFI